MESSSFSKVILRNRIYKPSELSIKMDSLISEKNLKSLIELTSYQDIKSTINDIYGEGIDKETLEKSHIYNSYLQVLNSCTENDDFKIGYKIREDMAIRITNHIYVCRIADDFSVDGKRIVPWYCMESEVYIADAWWEEDDEILNDFKPCLI